VSEKYIIDLYTVDSRTLKEVIENIKEDSKVYIHTAFFKNLSSIEEVRSISTSLLEITTTLYEYNKPSPELISYLPKGLSLHDFINDKNHFLLSLAIELGAIIITGDAKLNELSKASQIKCIYKKPIERMPSFVKYFTEDVMSLHLKEGTYTFVKRGKPGSWKLEKIGDKILTKAELENLIREVNEIARTSYEEVKEIERKFSLIAQIGNFRIVITKPPLSDGIEITIVKPVRFMKIEDYNISPKLIERLEKQSEGILIAGAPGMGKTTLAQALAEFYHRKNKIIKTIESPRDMQLPPEITQLSKTYASSEELHDVLLLSRPDYTIFDEMRDTKDFELYTDLRLAGVGMIGVVHATSPIDAIQRFVNRVELGMIPSIIDTVIFVKHGEINKVYTLETVVKVPHGLTEKDLSRPVIIVKDFETNEPEYEIYVFGERTFVVPIKQSNLEEDNIRRGLLRIISKHISTTEVEVERKENRYIVKVPFQHYNKIQNRLRRKIEKISSKYDVEIDVIPI